jgi:hypothetical protein
VSSLRQPYRDLLADLPATTTYRRVLIIHYEYAHIPAIEIRVRLVVALLTIFR